MALALVLAVTNSDIKSMNEIKNRLRLTENLFIRIPIVDIESPTESESSSGVSSLSPSIESSTPKPSPPLSRSDSPIKTTTPDTTSSTSEESKKCLKENLNIRVMHKDRDILNLGANLREPSWHRWNPRKPHYNAEEGPKNSNSVHFRLESKTCLTEDYPMRICRRCDFAEPSPIYFK